MPSDTQARPEPQAQIVGLARFAILATLAFALLLWFGDLANDWRGNVPRHLSENVVIALIYGIAAEAAAAIAAVAFLSLRKE